MEDRPLSYRQAMERARTLWKDGVVEILPHAQERMRQRRLDRNDLASIIRHGRVVQHSKPGQLWRYTIIGRSVDGEHASCVVEMSDSLIIVTVID
jgi:1,6-anhydro-N-acetylmuramate kinase